MSEKPTNSNNENPQQPTVDEIRAVCTNSAISWLNGEISTKEALITENSALSAWKEVENQNKEEK
jgi:hypothetical protein